MEQNHEQQIPGLPEPFHMIAIQGGIFDMGGESSLPVHPVALNDYWMGQHPVTQALWTAVMGAGSNPSRFKGTDRPVETVSWDVIDQEFLPRLNEFTKKNRPPGTAYRLPTEAEWEYAARGGIHWGKESYPYSGSTVLDEVGWYRENSHDETKPVGLKLPNRLGLYDMSGNVREWCADWYDSNYYQQCKDENKAVKNPKGPEKGTYRVDRGGSWFDDAQYCRSTDRDSSTPDYRNGNVGFRLVLFSLPV